MVRSVALALVVALVVPALARADGDAALKAEAERRNRRANLLYEQGRFQEALQLYQAAYDLSPEPRFLFNVGLAREKTFDYEGCAVVLGRFLRDARDVAPDVRKQAEERRAACLERALVPVRFTSAPTNAAVYLVDGDNEVLKGRTPNELPLAPGRYVVEMKISGYMAHRDAVTVEAGARPQVDFVLDKLSTLRIEADPSGARVRIDEGDWALAPVTREVPPGVHGVIVQKGGFEEARREIRVEPGQEVSLVLSLRPLPRIRSLAIRTGAHGPAASVRIDGEARGAAPLQTRLHPGAHRLELTAPGHLPFAGDISVPEDRDMTLLVHMEPHRSRRNRAVVLGVAGAATIAAVTGCIFGVMALQDDARFARDPTPALSERGERRAEMADVWLGTAVVLGGGALLYHVLTAPRRSTVRVEY